MLLLIFDEDVKQFMLTKTKLHLYSLHYKLIFFL